MRVLITGVTGFLGRNIAKVCANHGFEIVGLVHKTLPEAIHFPFPIEFFQAELRQKHLLKPAMANVDAVIHCAADTRMFAFEKKSQRKNNLNGIANLIDTAHKAGVKRFIYVSTANTIQPGTKNKPADESLPIRRSACHLPYVNAKIDAEELLKNAFNERGFPVIILHPTFILGPCGVERSSGKLLQLALKSKVIFFPSGGKNIVDVRDVAHAAVSSLTKGEIGASYLLSHENLSYRALFKICAEQNGTKPLMIAVPKPISWLMGVFGSMLEKATGKSISVNHKTMRLAMEQHFYCSDRAKRELNFQQRPVQQTLLATINDLQNGQIHD